MIDPRRRSATKRPRDRRPAATCAQLTNEPLIPRSKSSSEIPDAYGLSVQLYQTSFEASSDKGGAGIGMLAPAFPGLVN